MPVQSTNPEYDVHLPEWQMMDDALEGECAINRSAKYLPKPSGMVEAEKIDAAGNAYLYRNYRDRAQYEHWVRDSLRSMMGLVSRLIPEISLPSGSKIWKITPLLTASTSSSCSCAWCARPFPTGASRWW
jgi:hypothetical protein